MLDWTLEMQETSHEAVTAVQKTVDFVNLLPFAASKESKVVLKLVQACAVARMVQNSVLG